MPGPLHAASEGPTSDGDRSTRPVGGWRPRGGGGGIITLNAPGSPLASGSVWAVSGDVTPVFATRLALLKGHLDGVRRLPVDNEDNVDLAATGQGAG